MAEEETLEVEGPPPEESSNRLFIILAVLLGSIFIIGLLCIGLYAVFIGPRTAQARQTEAAGINAQNTQIVAQNTEVAAQMTSAFVSGQETQVAQASTATEEAIPDTVTPQPTNTLVIAPTSTPTPEPTETSPPTETLSAEQLSGTPFTVPRPEARRSWLYQRVTLVAGSCLIALLAGVWFVERAFDLRLL